MLPCQLPHRYEFIQNREPKMQEILYLEVPTPDTAAVCTWLQQEFEPGIGEKIITPDGFRLLSTATAARAIEIGHPNCQSKIHRRHLQFSQPQS